ncbi:PREDICTED: NACHT, LRR and PYD domains-containing protein 2-like [Galeopterus variegatus]|uniref:NACHT, LRR and PYD domains-containing protein 2-like n=1 Tax=Galeopterus variegatus TaxID=482537 RepID=A0ABM0RUL1_GALVR|nr:PREDICTED: NACHT, LRR and PYD domains-containing protein 2-like [Galeopterus variegatus]
MSPNIKSPLELRTTCLDKVSFKPVEGEQVQEMDNPELGHTIEDLEVEKPGKMVGYRNTMEKLSLIWKDTFWPGSSDNFRDDVTWRSQMFIPFLSSRTPTQPSPYTVVLHGPAGVGKTTVAKNCMVDWAKSYSQIVKYAFYLSCKELNHVGACTFAELISKDWPELKDDIKEVLLAQAQKILFIVDGFDELRAPPGALISDICGDVEATKPVPVLLSSLLIRKMVPRATLLITTRPRALRELRLLVEQPLFLEIEGLKHCQNLQELTLQVAKGIFLENDTSESAPQFERSQADYYILHHWRNLCSVVSSNRTLSFLDVSQSFLSDSTVRILCDYITRVTCHLQKVVIRNVFPTDAYRDFCLAFIGKKTLTHLTIEGCVQWDEMMLAMLCETLKHPRCNLQYLRLGSSSATTQQWADFSSALKINQSLMYLDLSDNELLDEGAKVLCATLRHPKCSLQRLSVENCHLTKASCKDFASVLMVNQRLTYLCLAKNDLGDGGVKLLGEGLSCPECKLQTLMLSNCYITKRGCEHILKILQEDSSLTNLDLSLNPIATGVSFLCEALKDPNCNLRCLGLWGCSITPLCCEDLASALLSNEKLETLDLFQNNLGQSGVTLLFEALKQKNGPLKTLRLKADEYDMKIQKLLKEVKESNPKLTIACNVASTTRSSYCDFLS